MDNDDREIKSLVLKKVQNQTSMKKLHDIKLVVENEHENYISEINSQLTSLPAASQMFTKKKKWCVTS